MTRRYNRLVSDMLAELITCWQRPQPEKILLESAFLLAQKHCNHTKSYAWQHGFRDAAEETWFFKSVQPQIAGRVMYYAFVYEAFLSSPRDPQQAAGFWEKELERYERFVRKNEEFVRYMTGGQTSLDNEYFLRTKTNGLISDDKLLFSCSDEQTRWSIPAIRFFADRNYRLYAETKLAELSYAQEKIVNERIG